MDNEQEIIASNEAERQLRKQIRLLLVDDHRFSRASIGFALDREADMAVVAQASSVAEARAILDATTAAIDLAIIDLHLPDGTGIEVIQHLKRCCPHARVVIMAGSFDRLDKTLALAAGAAGFLEKRASLDDMLSVIRQTVAGEPLLSSDEIADLLRGGLADRWDELPVMTGIEHLTLREREVLAAFAQGMSEKELAAHLGISQKTIHSHVTSIFGKLGVHSRSQALIAAIRNGLIDVA